MVSVSGVFAYLLKVLWSWPGWALGLLGLLDLVEKFTGRSWKHLPKHRLRIAAVLLFVAQADVYRRDRADAQPVPPTLTSPVVAENPDHAGLTDKLERQADSLRQLEKERDSERQEREKTEQRLREAEAKLTQIEQRTASCDSLAKLSVEGRGLVAKLRPTRAAPDTRREIDQWYVTVCRAMTAPQCEAFRAAPPADGVWFGYPVDDGGYSQSLRGRTAYLSAQLTRLCS